MLAALLRHEYALADFELQPIPLGVINRNYRVETPGGAFVLKQYDPERVPLETVRLACRAQAFVGRAGVPVAAIQPNRSGDLITVSDGAIFTLSRFVPGRHYQRSNLPPRPARAMGAVLGQLHLALADLEEVEPFVLPAPAAVLERLEGLLRTAEAHRGRSPVDEAACLVLQAKIQRLKSFPVESLPATLPAQWIHGDFQETNLLFDAEDRVAAVLDFDNLRRRPRILDLMRAMALVFTGQVELLPAAYDFLAGYLEVADPSEAEVALYAPVGIYLLLSRDWPIGARYEEPERYDPRWDRFIAPPGPWWGDEPDRVTEAFLKVYRSNSAGASHQS